MPTRHAPASRGPSLGPRRWRTRGSARTRGRAAREGTLQQLLAARPRGRHRVLRAATRGGGLGRARTPMPTTITGTTVTTIATHVGVGARGTEAQGSGCEGGRQGAASATGQARQARARGAAARGAAATTAAPAPAPALRRRPGGAGTGAGTSTGAGAGKGVATGVVRVQRAALTLTRRLRRSGSDVPAQRKGQLLHLLPRWMGEVGLMREQRQGGNRLAPRARRVRAMLQLP